MSIYRRAMGPEFDLLHPEVQKRFGFDSSHGVASVGTGVMDEMWRGAWWTVPFLWFGMWRSIMFPDTGREVPFSVHNYAYKDRHGRETITWVRHFEFPDRRRRFDATMIFSESRGRVIDYIGNHQHLAVDMECMVDEATGGMRFRSGEQRIYEGRLAFRFPLLFSGTANVVEWFDDELGEYRIEVEVGNRVFGPLFGYRGRFRAEFKEVSEDDVPPMVKPLREESRE